jgi:hypothetical protein
VVVVLFGVVRFGALRGAVWGRVLIWGVVRCGGVVWGDVGRGEVRCGVEG